MRALHGLADTLWEQGYREETLEIFQKMLRLNHSDNQGIRYLLGFRLLDENSYGEVENYSGIMVRRAASCSTAWR